MYCYVGTIKSNDEDKNTHQPSYKNANTPLTITDRASLTRLPRIILYYIYVLPQLRRHGALYTYIHKYIHT